MEAKKKKQKHPLSYSSEKKKSFRDPDSAMLNHSGSYTECLWSLSLEDTASHVLSAVISPVLCVQSLWKFSGV